MWSTKRYVGNAVGACRLVGFDTKPFGQAPSPNGGSLVVDKNVLLGNAFSRDLFWVGVRSNKVNPFDWALGFVNN